jgi:hypothetical protein
VETPKTGILKGESQMDELTVFPDDLVTVFRDNAVTTSLRVAEVFSKRHDVVLRAIENLVVDLRKNVEMFWLANYQDSYRGYAEKWADPPRLAGLRKNGETPRLVGMPKNGQTPYFKSTFEW